MDRTKEIAKEQGLNRLLLFTETGEGSCNMACKYCFLGKSGTNKKMSVEILHKAIDFLNLYAVGEPTYMQSKNLHCTFLGRNHLRTGI